MHYSDVNIPQVARLQPVKIWNLKRYFCDSLSKRSGAFLSVGFGQGDDLVVARELGFKRVIGIDVDKGAVAKLGKEFETRVYNGKKFPVPSSSLDVVMMNNVLEHLQDPVPTIKEIARVLKKGGHAIITTPDPSQANSYFSNFWADQTHVRPYHRIAVENLVKQNGFEVKRGYVRVANVPVLQAVLTRLRLYPVLFFLTDVFNVFRLGIKEVCVVAVKK